MKSFFYMTWVKVDQFNILKGLNSSNLNGLQGGVGHFLLFQSRSEKMRREKM